MNNDLLALEWQRATDERKRKIEAVLYLKYSPAFHWVSRIFNADDRKCAMQNMFLALREALETWNPSLKACFFHWLMFKTRKQVSLTRRSVVMVSGVSFMLCHKVEKKPLSIKSLNEKNEAGYELIEMLQSENSEYEHDPVEIVRDVCGSDMVPSAKTELARMNYQNRIDAAYFNRGRSGTFREAHRNNMLRIRQKIRCAKILGKV
jgi:hypothetical protein